MTETIEVLKAARELISDPKRWTQGHYAVDDKNCPEDPTSDRAVCFCSVGAIAKVMGTHGIEAERSAAGKALEDVEDVCFDIVEFNDHHTHAEVLAAFDAAISRASA